MSSFCPIIIKYFSVPNGIFWLFTPAKFCPVISKLYHEYVGIIFPVGQSYDPVNHGHRSIPPPSRTYNCCLDNISDVCFHCSCGLAMIPFCKYNILWSKCWDMLRHFHSKVLAQFLEIDVHSYTYTYIVLKRLDLDKMTRPKNCIV